MSKIQDTTGKTFESKRQALLEEMPVGYKRTNLGLLPNTWDAVRLGDLFVFKNGLNKAKHFFGTGAPIVNYMDVFESPGLRMDELSGRVNLSTQEIKNFEVRLGDVFFTRTSETVEEVGIASVMLDDPPDTVFSGFVLRARPRDGRLDHYYKQYCFAPRGVRSQIVSNATYTTRALTNGRTLSAVWIAVPPNPEQCAIAEALSDVDGLLAALEALIAKKRAIKQAAMQQLLTGKTRLPGFCGNWETATLGDVADLKNGYAFKSSTYVSGGMYQIITIANVQDGYLSLNAVNSISELPLDIQEHQKLSYGDLLISMTGNVGRVCIVKETHCLLNQRVGKLLAKRIDELFLYYIVHDRRFLQSMVEMAVGGAQGNLGKTDITGYTCFLPQNLMEQRAIAVVLSDMDSEIAALERRRDKGRAIKQGMMQQLLTGRTRLIQPETRSIGRTHNWQFNEAVVISVLAKHFGNEQYPLGRMRYTKLSYLLHRYEEGHAEGYLKKAAGPYNPQTRYRGPEKIALEKDYVRQHRSSKGQGFIASSNFDEAEGYFDKWYGSEVLQWLERFRYRKNNYLELLTTVDMAAEELREAREEVFVESIKEVIRSHPEWNPKLDRSIFSDANLARAIESCQKLFNY